MVDHLGLHRWRDAQRLVDPPEVVIHEVKRHGGGVVLHLVGDNVSVYEANDGSGAAFVVTALPKPDFSRMSVRWAVLWLLTEHEAGPRRTSEIVQA